MVGYRVFTLFLTISFLSLFGFLGQQTFAQTDVNQTNIANTIVGENGLIAVVPLDGGEPPADNGIIAVVPSVVIGTAQNQANTDTTQPEANGLIAVVPSQVSEAELAQAQSALLVAEPIEQLANLPVAPIAVELSAELTAAPTQNIEAEVSQVAIGIVPEAVIDTSITEFPLIVNQVNSVEENTATNEIGLATFEEVSKVEQVVEVTEEVDQVAANVDLPTEVVSNVTEYVQDAIENTVTESSVPEATVVETAINENTIVESASIEAESLDTTINLELQNVMNSAIALYQETSVENAVENIVESLPQTSEVEIVASALQPVKVEVLDKVSGADDNVVFDVKALPVGYIGQLTSEYVVRDIARAQTIDYGYSFTGESGFIKGLLEARASETVEATVAITTPQEPIQPIAQEEIQEEVVEEVLTERVPEVEIPETSEVETVDEPIESLLINLTELAKGTMFAGNLNLNQSINAVLASDINEAVYHTYQINVPEGQEALTIMVNGQEGDVDLAIKAGSEIVNYNDVDFIDNSGSTVASYSYQSPPSGPIFIDVMNYSAEPVAYVLTTSDVYSNNASTETTSRAFAPSQVDEVLETGHFFDLNLNSILSRGIASKEPSASMVYHSYELALPVGLSNVQVLLDGQGHDVDMAVSLGKPITRLDTVDFFDNSEQAGALYDLGEEFKLVEETILYIDVLNYLQESAHYELQVVADESNAIEVTTNTEIDNIRAYAPKIDTESISHLTGDVTKLNVGQRYEGTIANYLQVDQEDRGVAASQSFLLRVAEGTERFVVTLSANEDLDIAVKHASPIESYALKKQGGDWDYLDMRPTTDSRIEVKAPEAGFWYIDVIQANTGQGAAPYTLQVFYP